MYRHQWSVLFSDAPPHIRAIQTSTMDAKSFTDIEILQICCFSAESRIRPSECDPFSDLPIRIHHNIVHSRTLSDDYHGNFSHSAEPALYNVLGLSCIADKD